MIYAMADIHGQYEKYMKMLEQIHFCDDDLLYVIGDVLDRGPDGMKILKDMMLRSNVIPLLGNHEYMASMSLPWLLREVTDENVDAIESESIQGLVEWMTVGGETTIAEFHKLSREEQQDVLDYLMEFELYDVVETGGKCFLLVHAGLDHFSPDRSLEDYDLSEMIFHKPDYDNVYFKNAYMVTGHTPTRLIHAEEQGISIDQISPTDYKDEIVMKNNHIAIDCGAGYGGRLGCICLNTMDTYYV